MKRNCLRQNGVPLLLLGIHRDEHPHFKCNQCDQVIHLPHLPEDYIALLKEHQVEQLHLLVEGIGKDCLGGRESYP